MVIREYITIADVARRWKLPYYTARRRLISARVPMKRIGHQLFILSKNVGKRRDHR